MRHRHATIFALLSALCLLFTAGGSDLLAQQPTATIDSPSDQATNVSLIPDIEISTQLPIDPASLTHDYGRDDTQGSSLTSPPTIRLIPKFVTDSIPDSLHNAAAISGNYTRPDPYTLVFTPAGRLAYDTEYEIQITGLRVMSPGPPGPGGPQSVPVTYTSSTFTTIPGAYRVRGVSITGRQLVNCDETFAVQFNRPLSSTSGPSGAYLVLERLTNVQIINNQSYIPSYTPVSAQLSLSSDHRTISLDPYSSLVAGDQYRLKINTGYLTGNSSDNVVYHVRVRDHYALSVSVENDNPSGATPPSSLVSTAGTTYHSAGTEWLGAVTEDPSWYFVRWESADDPNIDGSTDPVIELTTDCTSLEDLDITAVFKVRDTIIVDVDDTTNCSVVTYKYNEATSTFQSIGTTGSYALAPGERLMIKAVPATGYEFTQWLSNDNDHNGATGPTRFVSNPYDVPSTHVDLQADLPGLISPGVLYGLCTEAHWDDDNPHLSDIDFSSIIDVTPELAPPCTTANQEEPMTVTAEITEECYELAAVYVDVGSGGNIYEKHFAPGTDVRFWTSSNALRDDQGRGGELNLKLTRPHTHVIFVIRPERFKLTVESELLDSRDPGYTQLGQDGDVRIGIWTVRNGERNQFRWFTSNANPGQDLVVDAIDPATSEHYRMLTFFCGELVEAEMEVDVREEGYSAVEWVSTSGYTAPTPTSTPLFRFVMDQDRKIRGKMKEHFRIRKIWTYENDADHISNVTEYLPGSLHKSAPNDINVWLNYDVANEIHYGTRLRILFNDPVDLNTAPANLGARDISERIDFPERGDVSSGTRLVYAGTAQNITSTSLNGRLLQLDLFDDGSLPGIPRGEEFALYARSGLRNSSGEPLFNADEFIMTTEMPGLDIILEGVTAIAANGDLFSPLPELYTLYAVAIGSQGSDGQLPAGNYPDGVDIDVEQHYGPGNGPLTLESTDKAERDDLASLMLVSRDEDGLNGVDGEGSDEIRSTLDFILDQLKGAVVITSTGITIPLTILTGSLTLLVASIIIAGVVYLLDEAYKAVLDNEDDRMGEYSWIYSWQPGVWFGDHPNVKSQQSPPEAADYLIEYNVDFDLKK